MFVLSSGALMMLGDTYPHSRTSCLVGSREVFHLAAMARKRLCGHAITNTTGPIASRFSYYNGKTMKKATLRKLASVS